MNSTGIVFDVDGVLVDTSRSFPEVVSCAVAFFARSTPGLESVPLTFTKEHYMRAKMHPMFNDDYDIAWTFLSWAASNTASISIEGMADPEDWGSAIGKNMLDPLIWVPKVFGSVVDRDAVRKTCEEMYFGNDLITSPIKTDTDHSRLSGLWRNEQPCLRANWRSLGKPVGIYTGRNRQELQLALKILNWEDLPDDHCITIDDSIKKPSPEGLFILEKILGVLEIFFFGDSESDRKTFEAYGKGKFFPIGDVFPSTLEPYGSVEEALKGAGLSV
jgi:phosphoglycolate phosphatase-like HAD superfamily hydrolase